MASLLVQQSVKDFADWKVVFDSVKDFRLASGELSEQVFHESQNPNKVSVLLKWDSLADAEKFSRSPELKAAMQKGGVMGPPTITYLDEA
jgi:heme-degrading monooxygenase HmoA